MADTWQARLERPATGPLLHTRIGEQVEHLKQEPTWRTGDRNAITLTKGPTLRVVLIVLGGAPGGELKRAYLSVRMMGRPLLSPRTMILALGLFESSLATSMAFHFRSSALMPRATIVWKSAMP